MSTRKPTGRLVGLAMWMVISASFGLSAQTWIEIARMAGFGQHADPFGLGHDGLQLAWLMPMVVDGYVVVALLLWMSNVSDDIAAFARKNTYAAAGFGVVAQSVFHAATIASAAGHRWWTVSMAAVVGAIPPGFAALAVHMRVLVARHAGSHAVTHASSVTDERPAEHAQHQVSPASVTVAEPVVSEQVTPDSEHAQHRSGNAEIVRRAHEANPSASHAELAKLLSLSTATVRRYRPGDRVTEHAQPSPVARVNGTPVPALIDAS